MHTSADILLAFAAAAALLFFTRYMFIRFISPHQAGVIPAFAVVPVSGDGEGLEQTLRHLQWLQREQLSRFTVVVVDSGLTPLGREAALALAKEDPTLLFCPAEEATWIFKRKDDHGYFSL